MKALSIASAALFVVSAVFPIVAGISRDTAAFPHWWGTLDVALAFALALSLFAVMAVVRHSVTPSVERTTYRLYRILLHGVFVIGVVFILAGDHIIWTQCFTGLAWRAWLLLYCLPWWVAAFRHRKTTTNPKEPKEKGKEPSP
jgi:hypothetical protein